MPGLAGEVANLIVALRLDDSGFTGKLNNVARTLNRVDAGVSRMGRGVGQVGSGIARLGTVAAAAAAGGLAAVVTTAVSFEDAFAGVRKTVDANDAQLDELMETLREMARTIPISFEELSAIGEQAGALGIATSAIDEFVEVVALLGETTDVTTEQAATSLGVLANVLHLREEDFDNFGSTLVDLGNKGASTESQILAIAERVGAGASLIGIAADETLGWSSAIANLGIEVEAGGTSLQKFFVESLQLIQDDDTLEVLAETAGVTGQAFKQAFEEDASAALQSFIIGLGKLTNAERLAVLEALGFSDVRITRALLGLAGDTDNLTTSLDISNTAWQENTALQTEAAKRFETTRSKLDLVVNNLRDAGYVIGNELLPIVADLSTEFVDFLNKPGTQEGIRDFAKGLADGIRGIAKELKGTDFSGIIGGMKIAAEVAKGAFDAFRALPQPIQQLAIAALVANKVSGGAVGQIAKGLGNILLGGGGVLGGLLGRGATAANPVWVRNVGLPGVGGGGGGIPPIITGGGGAGGLFRTLLGGASKIFAGLIVADLASQLITNQSLFDNIFVKKTPRRFVEPDWKDSKPVPVKIVTGAGKVAPPSLPNTALAMGPGGAVLPDTALAPLTGPLSTIAANTSKLPPILTMQQLTANRVNETRTALGRGFSELGGPVRNLASQSMQQTAAARSTTDAARSIAGQVNASRSAIDRGFSATGSYLNRIAAKTFSPTINLTNITNVKISTTALQTQITRARIATGTIPEFA